jgi:hypothetical protein
MAAQFITSVIQVVDMNINISVMVNRHSDGRLVTSKRVWKKYLETVLD